MLVGRDFFLVLVVSRVGQELSRLGQNQGVGAIHGCQRCFFLWRSILLQVAFQCVQDRLILPAGPFLRLPQVAPIKC